MPSSITTLLLIFSFWLSLSFLCCAPAGNSDNYKIVYRVDGDKTRSAHVTYANETGGTEMRNVDLPWTLTLNGSIGQFLYVSAQNQDDGGFITVSITVNGRIVKDATSGGSHAIATVHTRCCSN